MDCSYWTDVVRVKEELEGYEQVFIEYPGYQNNKTLFEEHFQDFVKHLKTEVEKLEPKTTYLVGCSYGGKVAMHLAEKMDVKNMILISTPVGNDEDDKVYYKSLIETVHHDLYKFSVKLIEYCYTEKERAENPFLAIMFLFYLKKYNLKDSVTKQLTHLADVTTIVNRRVCPLVIVGKQDLGLKENYKNKFLEIYSSCDFKEYENFGHFTLNNNPEAIEIIKKTLQYE
ncbi:hypothetical protein DBR28_17605 [Chryseobacterium sp. HMWF028]|nr:hypothetical protein DBR28_17605 [Chryseobacterium sp. HMWF028]